MFKNFSNGKDFKTFSALVLLILGGLCFLSGNAKHNMNILKPDVKPPSRFVEAKSNIIKENADASCSINDNTIHITSFTDTENNQEYFIIEGMRSNGIAVIPRIKKQPRPILEKLPDSEPSLKNFPNQDLLDSINQIIEESLKHRNKELP